MNDRIPDTICGLLEWRTGLSPKATACYSPTVDSESASLSWQDFHFRVGQFASAMDCVVDRPGVVAAIRLPSNLLWELLSHALLRLGCTIVGVDCQAGPSDVRAVLECCNAKLLVTDSALFENAAQSMPACVQTVILSDQSPLPGFTSTQPFQLNYWHELVKANGKRQVSETRPMPRGTDLATIVFTSGTTGEPKGIPFRHEQIMAACRAIRSNYSEIGSDDSTICWLPLSALFQRMVNLFSMACGMTTHFIDDPRQIFSELERLQPTFLVGVPRFYEKLNDVLSGEGVQVGAGARAKPSTQRSAPSSKGEADELVAWAERVKYTISGSAPLPLSLLESLKMKGVLVLEAYGLSENAVPMAANRASDYCFGSVGKPLAPNEIRLAVDGEIEVKGIGVFAGYFGQERNDCFTDDGYYRSGDVGIFNPDGFLFLTGRKHDLFKTSTGRRIGPSRIEAIYSACPSIDQIVVIGDNQKYLAALVTLRTAPPKSERPAELTSELIAEFRSVDQALSEHERVLAIGVLSRPFQGAEVTSSMKLKRRVILQKYATFIARLYRTPTPCVLKALPEEL